VTPISLQSGGLSVAFTPTVSTDLGRCDARAHRSTSRGFALKSGLRGLDNSDTDLLEVLFGPRSFVRKWVLALRPFGSNQGWAA
jgi:hypothetical protein